MVSVNGAAIGILIVAIFGGIWAIAGATELDPRPRRLVMIVAIAITLAFVFLAGHGRSTGGRFAGDIYGYAVAFEAVAIVIAVTVLRRRDRSLILPVISIIVGLHFIGLWLAIGSVAFLWLAAALCAVGTGAALSPRPLRRLIAGLGSAIVLWISALATILYGSW